MDVCLIVITKVDFRQFWHAAKNVLKIVMILYISHSCVYNTQVLDISHSSSDFSKKFHVDASFASDELKLSYFKFFLHAKRRIVAVSSLNLILRP